MSTHNCSYSCSCDGPLLTFVVVTQADHLAHIAEFFSFGTNDLTQYTFGISRDDAQVSAYGSKP